MHVNVQWKAKVRARRATVRASLVCRRRSAVSSAASLPPSCRTRPAAEPNDVRGSSRSFQVASSTWRCSTTARRTPTPTRDLDFRHHWPTRRRSRSAPGGDMQSSKNERIRARRWCAAVRAAHHPRDMCTLPLAINWRSALLVATCSTSRHISSSSTKVCPLSSGHFVKQEQWERWRAKRNWCLRFGTAGGSALPLWRSWGITLGYCICKILQSSAFWPANGLQCRP